MPPRRVRFIRLLPPHGSAPPVRIPALRARVGGREPDGEVAAVAEFGARDAGERNERAAGATRADARPERASTLGHERGRFRPSVSQPEIRHHLGPPAVRRVPVDGGIYTDPAGHGTEEMRAEFRTRRHPSGGAFRAPHRTSPLCHSNVPFGGALRGKVTRPTSKQGAFPHRKTAISCVRRVDSNSRLENATLDTPRPAHGGDRRWWNATQEAVQRQCARACCGAQRRRTREWSDHQSSLLGSRATIRPR